MIETVHHAELPDDSALTFLEALHRHFAPRIADCLQTRADRQAQYDAGERPDFPVGSQQLRADDWVVAPPPPDLVDRQVEITGPPERRMIINALNSGANVFMADFEDAMSPTWDNVLAGHRYVSDAIRRQIDFTAENGRAYVLCAEPATLIARPRGLHLPEKHVTVDGEAMPAALFDAGLFVYNNARALLDRGSGPYLYLPKLESADEAALWEEMLAFTEQHLQLPNSSIRVTVLIETLPAAFVMDEILYALRTRICGLNCGRWDYIFSYLKIFRHHPDRILPDRESVTMDRPFLHAYAHELIRVCHQRGAHAMGGMAAQIPVRDDAAANERAMAQVRADKEREATAGHDGTWVAHPGLIAVAREAFAAHTAGARKRTTSSTPATRADLLAHPQGPITQAGAQRNLSVALHYVANWLDGRGCVPINNLMEDAATAEIARMQVWHWVRHGQLSSQWVRNTLQALLDTNPAHERAAHLLESMILDEAPTDFLTLPAYAALD